MRYVIWFVGIAIVSNCTAPSSGPDPDQLREEVVAAEKAFAAMAADSGVAKAFLHFSAPDVILLRGKRLIRGKQAMQQYFDAGTLSDVRLSWEPEFVDVSSSGEMAYTYGPYTFSAKDTSGNTLSDTGYFHTVWKKLGDGQWRFVWD